MPLRGTATGGDGARTALGPGSLFLVLALAAAAFQCRGEASLADAVLAVAVPYDLDTLDPHAEDRLSSFALLQNIYEPLVDVDNSMRLRPCLALSWESPDPLTWIFHLRPGVRFHSGRALRAADVVYSLDRVRRDKDLQVGNFTRDVSEVETLSEDTLRLRTRTPNRMLLAKLRHVAIVPEGATAETLQAHPDGTGPYAVASWHRGEVLHLRRAEGHWGGARSAPRAVDVSTAVGSEEAVRGLLDRRYRLVKADSVKTDDLRGETVARRESLYVKYLAFDELREVTPFCPVRPNPFRDARVRRAVSATIDRKKLVASLSTQAVPATQPVPLFVVGYDPGIPDADVDRGLARRLLQEAGLGKGFDVVLHARPFAREAAASVAADLKEIGIRAEVRPVSDVEHFKLLDGGGLTLWITRIGCSTGDASELFEDLIHTRTEGFGSLNHGGYSNPRLDREIEASLGLEQPFRRIRALQQMMRTVVDEAVVVPLYNDMDVYALEKSIAWTPRSDGEIRAAEIGLGRRP